MNSTRTCLQCGTPLAAGAPAWLCSKCLLEQAIEGPEAEEPRWGEAVPSQEGRWGEAAPSHPPGAPAAEEPTGAAFGPATTPVFDESTCGPLGRMLPCRLGDYELVERIGQGGMGVVYRARQVSLDRDVAVKVLSPSALGSPEAIHRFQTEAVTAGSLQHPNIVAVHEVGHAEGLHYLVMDYVAGPTLGDLVRNGPLPARQAAQFLRTIAEAIHFAHEHGVLHRDLKPSNVLLDANHQPRVTDFGLAKRLVVPPSGGSDAQGPAKAGTANGPPAEAGTTNELTLSGQVLGSPAFIPPEQASGERSRVGRRSDVYALGAILYQLLTGRPPFVGEALADMLRQVLNEDPLSPRLLNPAVPRDLETVCLKCLEKEPDRRYPTARALAEELGRWLDGRPILARHLGPVAKTWRWCRRNPWFAGLAAALAFAVSGGFAGVLSQLQRARAAELTARRHTYAADMILVQQALEGHRLSTARELLDRYRPTGRTEAGGQRSAVPNPKSEFDLRGWEWRYFWARTRGEEQSILHQYPGAVSALAYSADGRWLAVRWEAGLDLWDATAWPPPRQLPARPKLWRWRNKALAFSPKGNLLAWGNSDTNGIPVVTLQDLTVPQPTRSLAHTNDVVSLAFSTDAKLLVSLAGYGVVSVWDLASGRTVTNLITTRIDRPVARLFDTEATTTNAAATSVGRPAEHGAPATPSHVARPRTQTDHYGVVRFSPDGRWLAVGESQPRIRMWDWIGRREADPLTMPAAADGVSALAFSPDSRWLAAAGGGSSGDVYVWELPSRAVRQLTGHRAWVTDLAFSPDGQTLATVSADETLRLWDVASGREQRRLQGNVADVWALAWSVEGRHLVTGARDGTVRYWDRESKPTAACDVLPARVWAFGLAFAPDGRSFVAVNYATTAVEKWNVATLQREPLSFAGGGHRSLDLSPDGRWLALGDTNEHVQVWDLPSERLATDWAAPGVFALRFRSWPRGRYLGCGTVTPAGTHHPRFWEVPTWREVSPWLLCVTNVFGLDLSPDERTLAIGYGDGTAAWLDFATGTRRASIPTRGGGGMHVKFSADGRWFVNGGVGSGLMTLWDVASGRSRPIGPNMPYMLATLVFSPDGRRLVTSGTSRGDLFRIWDVATGRLLLSLPAETDGFYTRLGFSPDGNTLFAASLEGTTLLWRAPSWEEIEAAEQRQKEP